MIFSFFKRGKKDIAILQKAERSLNITLVDTYEKLSKASKKRFVASAEYYNKCHSEYLAEEAKFLRRYEEAKNDKAERADKD